MNTRRQDTKHHHCELPDEPDDIVKTFIDTGIFVDARRKLKRFLMISPKHPLTRFYVKSLRMLKNEEKSHLIRHYNMIHPLSMFAFIYRVYMSLILGLTYFVWPIAGPYWSARAMNDVFCITHFSFVVFIILTFFTGYYDTDSNFVVLSPKRVAKKYLKTYFIFDVLSCAPFVTRVLIYKGIWSMNNFYARSVRWSLPMVTYSRYFYFLETFNYFRLYMGLNSYIYLALKTVIIFISIIFILNVLVYFTVAMQFWYKFYSCENKQRTVYDAVEAFMAYKVLPIEKRQRVFLYLNFKYQRHYYKESTIRKITSEALRREILIKVSKESTQKVNLFHKLPESILEKLRANIICEIYLPGDVIIKAGMTGRCMFFILAGTVVVKTPEGKEVCFLRDGSHFGEIALVVNIARVANVVAVSPCEVFRLNRKHFLEVVKNYPVMLKEIHKLALERIAHSLTVPIDEVDHRSRSIETVVEREEQVQDLSV
ncbi:potassium/sodium hyperpolarization-activated cyclic nucleotide-gated channel 2-like isoform X2 [Rhynchophorus ferrugineus]|uniref:potassium/sodium hyperpolarization-activated cyclic nucleotide-gated channel 2-like isoform X2 n=1 Tax=Rhynchophorus ferrugineus TaxID=354439 RepID=UPI003FCCEA70